MEEDQRNFSLDLLGEFGRNHLQSYAMSPIADRLRIFLLGKLRILNLVIVG